MTEPVAHPTARCGWCSGPFYKLAHHYWCKTPACAELQRSYGIGANTPQGWVWLYVPLPSQIDLERCGAPYRLAGGAAGGAKSHGMRWLFYKYALRVKNFEALILRRSFPELDRTHLRRMAREEKVLLAAGVNCEYKKADRQMIFHDTDAIIEAGHMEDAEAVERYLSAEYDAIGADEGAGYPPKPLMELSTRTVGRADRPEMQAAGGPFFLVSTNPRGPATMTLRDFFITHTPDFEEYPNLRDTYRAAEWVFVRSRVEDNPYLGKDYERSLALYGRTAYRQMRHGDWDAIEGAFFERWQALRDGRPHHVRRLRFDPSRVTWFRSLDWGRVSPGCCLWWAVLPEHHYHIAAELKFQGLSPAQVGAAILEQDARLGIDRVLYTAADPAIFIGLQDDGESIADDLRKAGVPCRDRISNDRVNGWARVDSLLCDDPLGNPWLTIDPSCRYLTRTFPIQQKSKTNPEDIDTTGDDHGVDSCFEAGTMILTDRGPRRIEKITLAHQVWTREGFRPVDAVFNSGVRDVRKVTLSDGTVVVCTDDHPVWQGDAFTAASSLRYGDIIRSWPISDESESILINIDAWRDGCGDGPLGRFPRAIIFITRMATARIMTWRIWRAWRVARILDSISGIARGRPWSAARAERPSRHGSSMPSTVATLAGPASGAPTDSTTSPRRATAAGNRFDTIGTTHRASVRGNARGAERTNGMHDPRRVVTVESSSPRRDQSARSGARIVVANEPCDDARRVYGITVRHVHEYLANGILVANCRYGAMSRPPLPVYRSAPLPPDSAGAAVAEIRRAIEQET